MDCPYNLFDRMKLEIESAGGVPGDVDYAAAITLRALLPEGAVDRFSARVTELTAGSCAARVTGEDFKAVPRIEK